MTVREHLKELKKRVFLCLALYAVLFAVVFVYSNDILRLMLDEAVASGFDLITVTVSEAMVQRFRIAGTGALVASSPFILWHVFSFWSQPERLPSKIRIALSAVSVAAVFLAGGIFAVLKMIPFMLSFLYGVTASVEGVSAVISLEKYVGFYISDIAVFGFMSFMPVMTYALTKLGLCSSRFMLKSAPYFLVISFIVGAVVTPPDVTSQLMVALPLMGVFWLSVLICKVTEKRRKHREDRESGDALCV